MPSSSGIQKKKKHHKHLSLWKFLICLSFLVIYKSWSTSISLSGLVGLGEGGNNDAPQIRSSNSKRVIHYLSSSPNDQLAGNRHSVLSRRFDLEDYSKANETPSSTTLTCPSWIDETETNQNTNCTTNITKSFPVPTIHPTCNNLHEDFHILDESISILSEYGTWRSAWLVQSSNVKDSSSSSTVLRMLQYPRHDYHPFTYALNNRDAIIMEQLSGIQSIVQEFGFCGQSAVTEYAQRDGLFLRQRIARSKIPAARRLQIALELSQGLHDMHIKKHIAHGDVKLVNVVLVEGRPKWNDFNFAVVLWNNEQCIDTPARSNHGVWRCPEELVVPNARISHYDRCDIYMFGNLIFELLTGQEPWSFDDERIKNNEAEIGQAKLQGQRPSLPDKVLKDAHEKELQLLIKAMNWCFQLDPKERPTAGQLVELLSSR